jgi:hypothetical protein
MVTFTTVRNIGRSLPEVEEGTAYGTPALKLRGKLLACVASHSSAEPNTLAVRIDFATRDELIEAEPEIYYLKDHYVDYACVLVRMSRIREDALRDLLGMAWKFVDASMRRTPRSRRRAKTPA